MKVFYCRIGWMSSYRGCSTEKPLNGGSYNKDNIGHEVHNYLGYNGRYYGFVEPGVNSSIHVERLGAEKNDDSVDNILVVWVSSNPNTNGQFIIGWYKDATVYRKLQNVPEDAMSIRELKTHYFYDVYSEKVALLEEKDRTFQIKGMGHSNIWYGNEEVDKTVMAYIDSYDQKSDYRILTIEKDTEELFGQEKETVVKTRINQDVFRKRLIMKYRHCCLCSVSNERLLIASHIKPWSDSDSYEKLDVNNGLLLCPNHDKLFDTGVISFADNGCILISDELDSINRIFMNVNDDMKIVVDDDNVEYMRYHREKVFKKSSEII